MVILKAEAYPTCWKMIIYEEICEEPWGNGDHGGNICHGSCDTIGGRENEECRRLYQYRIDRARLHKDDKILVSWNSWMICACAMAGAVLGEEQYVDMAVRRMHL